MSCNSERCVHTTALAGTLLRWEKPKLTREELQSPREQIVCTTRLFAHALAG